LLVSIVAFEPIFVPCVYFSTVIIDIEFMHAVCVCATYSPNGTGYIDASVT